jgi:signal transduction histidine kinase/uncharacterized membrane protein
MDSDPGPAAERSLRATLLHGAPLLARLALLALLLALVAWAWSAGNPVTALVGLLAALAGAAELLRFYGRRERTLLRVIETWAAGERASTATLADPQVQRALAAVNQRLFDSQGRLWAQIHTLQALVDHSPAALLRIGVGTPTHEATCEPLNNAARRLLALLGTGERPAVAALGADFEALVMTPVRPSSAATADAATVRLAGQPLRYALSLAELVTPQGSARIVALLDVQDALDRAQANAWRDLARVLSHEIMNALAPITSLAESAARELKASAGAPSAVAAVDALARRTQSLLRFVEAYRAMARPLVPRAEVIALAPWLEENLLAWRAQWGDAVQWRSDIHPPTLALLADPALLQQAVGALATNAAEAARQAAAQPGGAVATVALRAEPCGDGRVMLAIDDSGGGIAPPQREQVLVPFYTTKPGGSGIGLSLARQIVLAHGGRLSIEDSPLGGARVAIELRAAPVRRAAASAMIEQRP